MSFNPGITTIVQNIGLSFEWTICFIVLIAGFILYGLDFKIGVITHFLTFGLIFIWFYQVGYNFVTPLIFMFIFLVIMALTLYMTYQTTKQAGFT